MTAHTPGPYSVHPDGLIVTDQTGYPVATAYRRDDAPLIAAAPDLLALVREVESRADYTAQEAEPDSYVHSGLIRIRDDCRALLATLEP